MSRPTVYRGSPDFDEQPRARVSLAEVPGADVEALEVRHLVRLPEPWRIRVQIGTQTIDACSTVVPGTWGPAELLYMLAAALLGRIGPQSAERAAGMRNRIAAGTRWSWEQVSGGLVGVDPESVEGTVGEALARIRGRILGAWSGPESGQSRSEHEQAVASFERGHQGPVRGVRKAPRKRKGSPPTVPEVP